MKLKLLISFFILQFSSWAGIKYVDDTGSDANPGTSASPYLTVATAMTNIATGDTIYIYNGTYGDNDIAVTKSCVIMGESEAGVIFDNSNTAGQRCFNITGAGADVTFLNLTIQNYTDGDGTAIYAYKKNGKVALRDITIKSITVSSSTYDGAVLVYFDTGASTSDSVSFIRCTFQDITDQGNTEGTAITIGSYTYDYDYPVLIDGCIFDNCDNNNSALDEGAVSMNSGYSLTVKNSIFRNNSGHCYSSSIYCSNLGSSGGTANRFYMENCLFHDNATYNFGGAVRNYMADGDCWNSTFVQNTNSSATTYNPTGFHVSSAVVDFHNCIFDSNDSGNENLYGASSAATAQYSDFYGGFGNTYLNNGNNITSDVLFTDESTNDFTLSSSSPAIDAGLATGAPTTDIDGNTRSAVPDLGCYEIIINTWTGSTSTAWLTATNWSLGTVPTSIQTVSIPNVTNQPIITSTVTVAGMTVDASADITVSSNSLTVTGSLDLNGTLFIDNATVNADGNFDATGGTIDFTNVNGILAISSTSTSLGTLDVAMGTVQYDAAGAQNVLADGYYNLEIAGSGTKTSQGTITVAGNFTVTSGTYDVAATTNTVSGATSIVAGQTLSISTGTFNADGSFTANTTGIIDFTGAGNLILSSTVTDLGVLDVAAGTVKYDAAGAQSVLADSYYSLEIGGSGTKTPAGTVSVAGNFTLTAGTYDVSTTTTTVTGTTSIVAGQTLTIGTGTFNADGNITGNTTGNITFSGSGNLILSSTVTDLGVLDNTIGTVTYDGGTQSVLGDSYFNLTISTAGTKSASGNIDVNGDFTTAATASCKLDMVSYTLSVAGNFTVGATDGLDLTDASSLLTFDGTGTQTITHAGNSSGSGTTTLLTETFDNAWSSLEKPTASWSSDVASNSAQAWHRNNVTTNWNYTSSGAPSANGYTGGGTDYYARFHSFGITSPNNTYIQTPTVDLSTYTAGTVTFYYVNTSGTDVLEVYFYNGTTWVKQGSSYTTQASWSQKTIAVSGAYLNASFAVRFKATSDYGSTDIGLDQVVITGDYSYSGSESTDLTINKASGNIVLSSVFRVDGVLTLSAGDIDATSNSLKFTSNGTVTGASNSSHVTGTIVKTTEATTAFTFPIGDGTTYRPISITPSATTSTDWTVSYSNTGHANTTIQPSTGLDHISGQEYWNLGRSVATDAIVAITWIASNNITDYTQLRIAHFDGTTDWDMITSTPVGTNSAGTITSDAAVTTFSPFTIGSTGSANPLPVSLSKFIGYPENNSDNKLEWTTLTEKNADFIEIEKSNDGVFFEKIGNQKLAGNSLSKIEYEFFDRNVDNQINYYRLKQFDFDGKYYYSKIISIDNRGTQDKEILQITNLIGQKIDKNYKGVVIIYYSDGSSMKTIQ